MDNISVCISAYNCEAKIRNALESVRWADEIIVVDGPSTDNTEHIAREYTDKVYKFPYEQNLSVKKNFSFGKATKEWIMYVDSDEVVPGELIAEVRNIIGGNPSCSAYYIPRKNHFLGKWIRHCGWYPDYTLRLFRKGSALFPCDNIHETVRTKGAVGCLKNHVNHYPHSTISEYIEKMNFFTTSEAGYTARLYGEKRKWGFADLMLNAGERKPILREIWARRVPLKPLIRFFTMYFLRMGFLDGYHGFLVCVLSAFYDFTHEAKTKELFLNGKDPQGVLIKA